MVQKGYSQFWRGLGSLAGMSINRLGLDNNVPGRATILGALVLLVGLLNVEAQLIWNFSSSDGVDTVTGTFTSDGSAADLTGGGTHTFNVVALQTLNINGTEVTDADIIGAPPRSSGEGTFGWDQVNQESTQSSSNWLILQKDGVSALLQIGHGQVACCRHRTFTSGLSPSVDFVPTSTTYAPVPEPRATFMIVSSGLLGWLMIRRKQQASVVGRDR
jgi:hypothetical protein